MHKIISHLTTFLPKGLLEARDKTQRQQRQQQRQQTTLRQRQQQQLHLQKKRRHQVRALSWKDGFISFYFSGDTAASNETNVCWVSDIKMKDLYICNFRYNWTHFKVASNETEPAGTAAPPAPTTTTTTTTTTTEKPLEPCQCLGDPSLLNNTDNVKWGSVSRKLTLTRLFQKSSCLLSQHDFSHNNRWSRPCARTLPVSTSKRWRSHFVFWNIPATSAGLF